MSLLGEENVTYRPLDESDGRARRRFSAVFVGSVALHVGLVAALYLAHLVGAVNRFGMFSLDDDPNYEARYRVARVDTAPLNLPRGFYAQQAPKPAEEPRERAEKPKPKAEKAEKAEKKEEPKTPEQEQAAGETPEEPTPPQPPAKREFGKIKEKALKVHMVNAYRAYEQGLIPDHPFTVAVTCRVQEDGSLSDIRIVKSSGIPLIDETALNLFRELSDMGALGPLATLSSLSLTLEKGASYSSITAVGFAADASESAALANELNVIAFVAKNSVRNDDQRALLQSVKIGQTGNRVSVRMGLPNSTAGAMMKRSYGTPGASTARATS